MLMPPSTLVAVAPTPSTVQLTWKAATSNQGINRYRIFRNGKEFGSSNTNSFTDITVTKSRTYTYYVSAYDNAGNASVSSNTASVITPDTLTSDNFSFSTYLVESTTTNSAQIKWITTAPTEGTVYYGSTPTNLPSSLAETGFGSTHYMRINGLVQGATYYYKIVAKNGSNTSTLSTPVTGFTTTP